ncbi:MAG: amidohydrolase [Chloroflexi bacterium]|nr:amidohydrolase [Chloroflexota bacterium]
MGADLILYNGSVRTMDPACPTAQAVAVAGKRILAVGKNEEVLSLAGPGVRLLDLGGCSLLPGFEDAHLHLCSHGLALTQVDLGEARSLEEALARLERQAAKRPAGAWLRGRGWNHNSWPKPVQPTRYDLDRVVGERPVALVSKDGHALWVNSAVLRLAGISRHTPDPPGGEILRDASGEPNGILTEKAQALIWRHVPEPDAEAMEAAARAALADAARHGITALHNCEGPAALAALRRLQEADALTARVWHMIPMEYLDQARALGLRSGFGDEMLRLGHIKMFADGALGSGTAEMLAPYEDWPDRRGVAATSSAELWEAIVASLRAGLAPAIHAIGDAANRRVLDLYARAYEKGLLAALPHGLRPRIEHAQLLTPEDIPRLGQLGVVASMQPIHATQDMAMADLHWGKRARWGYAWRSLLERGAILAFGSDCPVETLDPLAGLYAAVTRRRADGTPPGGWYPEEALTLDQALEAYTRGSARACGQLASRGSLAPGKLADLVVLSRDLYAGPAEAWPDIKVRLTLVGGRIVWES